LCSEFFGETVSPSPAYMHASQSRSTDAGFTLIELLTVIAIIGILAAIIIPTVGKVRNTAQRTVDANSLREIAKAAMIYATDNNDRLPDPNTTPAPRVTGGDKLYIWAGLLAKSGALSDPTFYFSKNDPKSDGNFPSSILDPADAAKNTLLADFTAKTPSVELVGGLKMSDPSTTPIAFTRGLKTDGTWDNNADGTGKSVYGDDGGYIVFLGGNVQFYKDLGGDDSTGKLTKTNGKPTNNITETIPRGSTQLIYGRDGNIGTPGGVAPTAAN